MPSYSLAYRCSNYTVAYFNNIIYSSGLGYKARIYWTDWSSLAFITDLFVFSAWINNFVHFYDCDLFTQIYVLTAVFMNEKHNIKIVSPSVRLAACEIKFRMHFSIITFLCGGRIKIYQLNQKRSTELRNDYITYINVNNAKLYKYIWNIFCIFYISRNTRSVVLFVCLCQQQRQHFRRPFNNVFKFAMYTY
jgi:hypothetical protein